MTSIIGLRREDKNPRERRVPLIPSHIRELVQEHSLEFIVQPSSIRIFHDDDFVLEGARVEEDLSPCTVVFAVKEIPIPLLAPGKTYLFFSHTTKGQAANRPMLRRLKELGCTLIDYEKIVDDRGRRLLFFGKQAGQAGMIDTLWALGLRLKREGLETPFNRLLQMARYTNLTEAKEEIGRVAADIREKGLPEAIVPLVTGFAGYGNVSLGAQEIYDLLPVVEIAPREFAEFMRQGGFSPHRVYKIVFHENDMVRTREASRLFDRQEYYRSPELYEPVFEPYLEHLTVLMNGIYWAPQYPRFITKAAIRKLFSGPGIPRLRIIGDISCDIEGGVECTLMATDSKDPVFIYDPVADAAIRGFDGRGPAIMSVDNLPAEISLDSSIFFSQALKPFVPSIARAEYGGPFEGCGLPAPIQRATILWRGEFTPPYEYMKEYLR